MGDIFLENKDKQYHSPVMLRDMETKSRPREKAIERGIGVLTNAELLALLIGSGSEGETVVDLCDRILRDNDSKLYNLERMDIKDLMRYRGIGEAKAVVISAAMELARRCRVEKLGERPRIMCSKDVYELMLPYLGKLEYEELWILSLNQNNIVTNKICVSRGGTSATVGDVKLILKELLQRMAIGAIMVHNHPSDSLRPSRQDDDLTQRVKRGCDAVGITFLDHVIVTRDGFYSYGDNGIL